MKELKETFERRLGDPNEEIYMPSRFQYNALRICEATALIRFWKSVEANGLKHKSCFNKPLVIEQNH
jgi:hypothetical protein